jgi:hypothetical protein
MGDLTPGVLEKAGLVIGDGIVVMRPVHRRVVGVGIVERLGQRVFDRRRVRRAVQRKWHRVHGVLSSR